MFDKGFADIHCLMSGSLAQGGLAKGLLENFKNNEVLRENLRSNQV